VNRTLPVLFLFTPIVFSQSRLEVGVRIDAPLLGPVTTYPSPQSCLHGLCGYNESAPFHPAIGLSASIPIAGRLRLRFDPAYQRIGISANIIPPLSLPPGEEVTKISTTANRWQFPALVEADLFRHLRFGVGPVVSLLTGAYGIDKFVNYPFLGRTTYIMDEYSFPVSRRAIAGATAALEFPFRLGNITLAPELRYKRWFDKHYGGNSVINEFTGGVAIRLSRSRPAKR
jgi:hypothetical protein